MSEERRKLAEGVDYYYEGPYLVFTEAFLRARGYCCENGCRHCPYGFRSDVRSDIASAGSSDAEAQAGDDAEPESTE